MSRETHWSTGSLWRSKSSHPCLNFLLNACQSTHTVLNALKLRCPNSCCNANVALTVVGLHVQTRMSSLICLIVRTIRIKMKSMLTAAWMMWTRTFSVTLTKMHGMRSVTMGLIRGHPFMFTKKSRFWPPSPVHMGRTPSPLVDSLEMASTMTYRT